MKRRTLWERTSGAGRFLMIMCFIFIVFGIFINFRIAYIDGLYGQVELDIEYLFNGLRKAAFFCISLILFILWNFVLSCFNTKLENNKLEIYLLIIYTTINFGFLVYSEVSFLIQPRMLLD